MTLKSGIPKKEFITSESFHTLIKKNELEVLMLPGPLAAEIKILRKNGPIWEFRGDRNPDTMRQAILDAYDVSEGQNSQGGEMTYERYVSPRKFL